MDESAVKEGGQQSIGFHIDTSQAGIRLEGTIGKAIANYFLLRYLEGADYATSVINLDEIRELEDPDQNSARK